VYQHRFILMVFFAKPRFPFSQIVLGQFKEWVTYRSRLAVVSNTNNVKKITGSRGGSSERTCHKRVITNDYCSYCSGSHFRARCYWRQTLRDYFSSVGFFMTVITSHCFYCILLLLNNSLPLGKFPFSIHSTL
jgi:hypothetical protein